MEGLRNLLFEKLKEAVGALKGIKDAILASSLRDKLEQTKGVMESMREKLPQLVQFLSRKVKEAEGAVKSSWELISEPLKGKLPLPPKLWDDVVGFFVGKLEGVLPAAASPEALRILVQLVLSTILLKAFTYCLKGAFKMVTSPAVRFYRCCCFFFRLAGKTMKAPGRKGLRILRATFESDPKRYFSDLRANGPMEVPRRPSKKLCLGLVLLVAVVAIKFW
ncbi:hypothetical protein MUK42_36520 [Musa troglodytarum]|uniref:Uncharacterized protein n=1 Tax=Musa troglodytarum TaxID=320322 RepID=A0A9E7FKZ5_9LILI|nr:hypothetical protein MUK42_36520 [Musa troglodytarum]